MNERQDPTVKIIKSGPHRAKRIRVAEVDPNVRAIVVVIDSPGGRLPIPPAPRIDL